jgi:hypothetical protein
MKKHVLVQVFSLSTLALFAFDVAMSTRTQEPTVLDLFVNMPPSIMQEKWGYSKEDLALCRDYPRTRSEDKCSINVDMANDYIETIPSADTPSQFAVWRYEGKQLIGINKSGREPRFYRMNGSIAQDVTKKEFPDNKAIRSCLGRSVQKELLTQYWSDIDLLDMVLIIFPKKGTTVELVSSGPYCQAYWKQGKFFTQPTMDYLLNNFISRNVFFSMRWDNKAICPDNICTILFPSVQSQTSYPVTFTHKKPQQYQTIFKFTEGFLSSASFTFTDNRNGNTNKRSSLALFLDFVADAKMSDTEMSKCLTSKESITASAKSGALNKNVRFKCYLSNGGVTRNITLLP